MQRRLRADLDDAGPAEGGGLARLSAHYVFSAAEMSAFIDQIAKSLELSSVPPDVLAPTVTPTPQLVTWNLPSNLGQHYGTLLPGGCGVPSHHIGVHTRHASRFVQFCPSCVQAPASPHAGVGSAAAAAGAAGAACRVAAGAAACARLCAARPAAAARAVAGTSAPESTPRVWRTPRDRRTPRAESRAR